MRTLDPDDACKLAAISKFAFEGDVEYGAPAIGGPPGDDSPAWQEQTAREATAYFVIEEEKKIVGGMIVIGSDGDYWLGRMFIDPTVQRRGIGLRAIELLEQEFPGARRWSLETPPWNARTQRFYEKAGYLRTGVPASGDWLFEKHMARVGGQ